MERGKCLVLLLSAYICIIVSAQLLEDEQDPRAEEGWWGMYPYGKMTKDNELVDVDRFGNRTRLGFDFPYFGFRFDYAIVFRSGFISFATPSHAQPPFTFPNPSWPNDRDHSFIAPFYADATYQYVDQKRISNVWYRSIKRDTPKRRNPFNPYAPMPSQSIGVVDEELLDNITRDIQEGINGADGFRAEFAFIVTWERMAYGGAPEFHNASMYEMLKKWSNTYQAVLTTDGIRSYVIFNYAHLNWTTSNEAGGLNGFGGKQAAMVGFNGGNGTGWVRLPYSSEGRVLKLSSFTNVLTPGRWIYRVDEEIISGGCSNESVGYMVISPNSGIQIGGMAVNVSGMCMRENDSVVVMFDERPVNCVRLNRIRARCIIPMLHFHKTGMIDVRMSRDGGQSYPYISWFYVLAPQQETPKVILIDDEENPNNQWSSPTADMLSLEWKSTNLTWDLNAAIDVNLWGYFEEEKVPYFQFIDSITTGLANTGLYAFSPKDLVRKPLQDDPWDFWRYFLNYRFGLVQVALSNTSESDEGVLWSRMTPFSWYFLPKWQEVYGATWALDLCIEWYLNEGHERNFADDLEPCPCRVEQAMLDLGRFMPIFECDRDGDTSCSFNKGASHCVVGVQPAISGAGQQCCYDSEGDLITSDDWEPKAANFNPATAVRAHAFGASPYDHPLHVPGFSNYQQDVMPYYMCCVYAQHCELYFWRRQTQSCHGYVPPTAAYIFGEGHIRTYAGNEFTFSGTGYYTLAFNENPHHRLTVQARLEQPPQQTIWSTVANASVVTGVAIRGDDDTDDVVQVFARYPSYRDWRYKLDVYVNGIRLFFDEPHWKYQQFRGVNIRNPLLNLNQSEVIVMLDSGAGVRVQASNGMLDVMVILPPPFNTTCDPDIPGGMTSCYITKGLLGAFTNQKDADLITPDGRVVRIPKDVYTRQTTGTIYEEFGMKWKIIGFHPDPHVGQLIFQDDKRPIYGPPVFQKNDEQTSKDASFALLQLEDVEKTCTGVPQCEHDYVQTGRRDVAVATLENRNKFIQLESLASVQAGELRPRERLFEADCASMNQTCAIFRKNIDHFVSAAGSIPSNKTVLIDGLLEFRRVIRSCCECGYLLLTQPVIPSHCSYHPRRGEQPPLESCVKFWPTICKA